MSEMAKRALPRAWAGRSSAGRGWRCSLDGPAWILKGRVAVALAALVLGRFCLGSYLYHLLRGEISLAYRTLPWSRVE